MSAERVAIVVGGASGIGSAVAQAWPPTAAGWSSPTSTPTARPAPGRLGAPHSRRHVDVTEEDSVRDCSTRPGRSTWWSTARGSATTA